MERCACDPNVWHTELDGDPYFVTVLTVRSWRVTRQVALSDDYRSHLVVLRRTEKLMCDCNGFERSGNCRHVKMVKDVQVQ